MDINPGFIDFLNRHVDKLTVIVENNEEFHTVFARGCDSKGISSHFLMGLLDKKVRDAFYDNSSDASILPEVKLYAGNGKYVLFDLESIDAQDDTLILTYFFYNIIGDEE